MNCSLQDKALKQLKSVYVKVDKNIFLLSSQMKNPVKSCSFLRSIKRMN